MLFNLLSYSTVVHLSTVYYWAWDVCVEQFLRPSYSLGFFPTQLSACSDFDCNEAFPLRENHIVYRRRIETLYIFLLYKTKLLKPTS